MPRLRSDGLPLQLAPNITISTPGLEGEATLHADGPGTRALNLTTSHFREVLLEHGFQIRHTIQIKGARETRSERGVSRTRTPHYGEEAIVLDLTVPNASFRQVVLLQDEAGVIMWNFAEPEQASGKAHPRGGSTSQRFILRRYVPKTPAAGTQRGLSGALGSKVIKVLAFPIHEAAGKAAVLFARKIEARYRPYGLRIVTADTYTTERAGTSANPTTWKTYEGKPALLLVHGTFSTSAGTFGMLPAAVFKTLFKAYGGRVLAFDHPTMSQTPQENAEWLLKQIPRRGNFVFDVLTHSRGGLVARTIAEKSGQLALARNATIRTLVLTGVPDNGTTLTDAKYMGDFIDTYTNLLNFFPNFVAFDVLHCILAAVKEIAVGALAHLSGLQAMAPNGPFQRWLNAGPKGTSHYYAVGSAYSPSQPGLVEWAKKRLMDTIFKVDNDLVVPTAGVYAENGSRSFPIAARDRLLFGKKADVWHCNYFAQPDVHGKLRSWLK